MKSFLVTGGSGFIGGALIKRLASEDIKIALVDPETPPPAVEVFLSEDSYVKGSILDAELIDCLVSECSVVIHLGAEVGLFRVLDNQLRGLDTNVLGTRAVLDSVALHRKKVIIASSSEVYGQPSLTPIAEESPRTFGPTSVARWSYGESKAIGEFFAHALSKELGLRFTIARLFNTVGPGQTGAYGMVVPRMVGQALRGEPITVFGDGSQTRCFCHVDDVSRALIDLAESPDAVGETVNVGSQVEISILELAERIINVLGSSSKITFVPYDQAYGDGFAETYRRVPDISKIESLIGWRPQKTLDDIIVDVAEYLRVNPDA